MHRNQKVAAVALKSVAYQRRLLLVHAKQELVPCWKWSIYIQKSTFHITKFISLERFASRILVKYTGYDLLNTWSGSASYDYVERFDLTTILKIFNIRVLTSSWPESIYKVQKRFLPRNDEVTNKNNLYFAMAFLRPFGHERTRERRRRKLFERHQMVSWSNA